MINALKLVFQLRFVRFTINYRPNVLRPIAMLLNASHPPQKPGAEQLFRPSFREFTFRIA
jgi:hypothetical protein